MHRVVAIKTIVFDDDMETLFICELVFVSIIRKSKQSSEEVVQKTRVEVLSEQVEMVITITKK